MRARRAVWAAALILGAAAGAFALNLRDLDMEKVVSGTQKVVKGAFKMSDKDEAALGREVASYLCARYGLSRDKALTRYVNLVGRAAALRSERPELSYHFGVLETGEVNAYAAPGGYIFVTRGLLSFLKDESELAGALGHEVTHVAHRHVAREIQKSNLLQGGIELASAKKGSPEALKAASDFTIKLLFKGFSRKDEEDADRSGLAYAAAAGYDPAGLARVLERMAGEKKDEPAFKTFDKSHPPAKERLKVVQAALKSTVPSTGGVADEARFRKTVAAR